MNEKHPFGALAKVDERVAHTYPPKKPPRPLRRDSVGPVTPPRISLRKLVQISRHLHESSSYARIARVILTFVGVDVPLSTALKTAQCLIGLAVTTLDRDILDIDRLHEEICTP